MIKYQNYKYYKLPITIKPLKYGKLIVNVDSMFVVQINKTNIALIHEFEKINKVKIFKEGDLIFEYSDHKLEDGTFIRVIDNKKFRFENNELKSVTDKILINRWKTINQEYIKPIRESPQSVLDRRNDSESEYWTR